ncbi:aminotransferase class I/II-fold pyridoxal phosphate-dependent enzyme [Massilia rhizosphaerae]|uniref:aminotransferase class I/II-fold pyridoxal phosphate-dependent enzyme n=1 Tax=Massilia rhizosphaerae TaxID=2784389 RepID=UPI0018DB1593|nr:aminotransferase class I/II-fold pyridoxal phosphate-dependent enzyme [Massilia rhizosphaerae]
MPSTNASTPARRAIPPVPVLSLAAFAGARRAALPSLLDGADVRLVTSGRIAIGLALRALGVGAGDVVLVPAYHSPSMVPPAHWCGADVAFYRVRSDTAPDLADIEAHVAKGNVKAILATHFFGIPHDLAPLRALCDRHGIGLVEDCAHAFFGARDGVAVGSVGDYAIGSTMKFFPVYEGGCLVSRRHRLDVVLHGAGPGFEMKAALNALEAAFAYGRLPVLRMLLALPLRLKSALWHALKSRGTRAGGAGASAAPALAPSSSDSSFEFDARWADKRSSWLSRTVLRAVSPARIVARRRRNYLELQRALDGAPGCRPLFDSLPDGACPWMFPLLVDRPQDVSDALLRAGVPMTRFGATLWPGVDASVCANSADLGRRLIAFPCHQALDDAERAWLHAQARQALEACAAVPA